MQRAVVLLLLLATGLGGASHFDPHLPDMLARSWFQGWYLRLTAEERGLGDAPAGSGLGDAPASLALILGYVPRGREGWNSTAASLVVQRSGHRPVVYETNALQLSVGRVLHQPDPGTPPDLNLTSADGSFRLHVDKAGCSGSARFWGVAPVLLTLNCVGPPARPWGPGGEGPEGTQGCRWQWSMDVEKDSCRHKFTPRWYRSPRSPAGQCPGPPLVCAEPGDACGVPSGGAVEAPLCRQGAAPHGDQLGQGLPSLLDLGPGQQPGGELAGAGLRLRWP